MEPNQLWETWRQVKHSHTRVMSPLTVRSSEIQTLFEIAESVESDEELLWAVERFFTLTPKELNTYGIKTYSLGFLRMALPRLMSERQQVDSEDQKFLEALKARELTRPHHTL